MTKMKIKVIYEDENSEHLSTHCSILRAMGAKEKKLKSGATAFAFEELPREIALYSNRSAEFFEGDFEKLR